MELSAAPHPAPTARMQFYGERTAGHLNAASVCVIEPSLESDLIKTQQVPKNSRGKEKYIAEIKISRQAAESKQS